MAFQDIKPKPYYTKQGKNFNLQYDPTNGNVQLIETGLLAIGTTPLFYDGNFRTDFLNNLGVTEQEKNNLYAQIQNSVNTAHKNAGGNAAGLKLPSWAQLSQIGQPPGSANAPPGANPPIPGLGSILSPVNPVDINNSFVSDNAESVYGGTWKYPSDILELQQDTLQISQYRYRAPNQDLFTQVGNFNNVLLNGLQRNSAIGIPQGIVILPIPSGVQDSNGVDWGGGNVMSNLTAAVSGNVYQDPVKAALGQAGTSLGTLAASLSGMNLPQQSINQILTIADTVGINNIGDLLTRQDTRAILSSLLLKNAGFDVSPETILSRGFGIVPNSNLELLFNGPTLRQFRFTYRMSPRSEEEALEIRKIIRFFKQGMAARKQNAQNGSGASSLFLGTPNVFKLEYKSGGRSIPGLNKFKICALTGLSANYAPDGTWAAYDGGQPVSLALAMDFQELEPIYESDYQETVAINDNPKVGPDDIGY
jgi:hypothetical protein